MTQEESGKYYVYAMRTPEALCNYRKQTKESVCVLCQGIDCWMVGARTFKGNQYDAYTLGEAFDQIKAITDCDPR